LLYAHRILIITLVARMLYHPYIIWTCFKLLFWIVLKLAIFNKMICFYYILCKYEYFTSLRMVICDAVILVNHLFVVKILQAAVYKLGWSYYGGEGELLKYVCVGQVNKMWSCHGGHGFYFCSLCTLSEYKQVVELVNLAE